MSHRLSKFLVFLTGLLLFLGGLVTSTGSGLAVPDWPLSYGTLFPPMIGGIRFEHTHRVIASLVGLLSLILTLWVGVKEKRKSVRRLAITSFGFVVLQGILGGVTVLHRLPAPVSAAHALLGPIFFSSLILLMLVTSPGWPSRFLHPADEEITEFHPLAVITAILIFLQMLLGAVVRHTGDGVWFHVTAAFLVLMFAAVLVSRVLGLTGPGKTVLFRPALIFGILTAIEFFLGAGALIFKRLASSPTSGWAYVLFPTFHQTFGAFLLVAGLLLAFLSSRALSTEAK